MLPAVVDGFHPSGEQGVQLNQVVEFTAGADLDQELVPDGPEEPFDFAAAGRFAGPRMDEPDPEAGAGTEELFVDHRSPVVEIHRGRDTAGGETGPQRGLQSDGVFAAGPPVA